MALVDSKVNCYSCNESVSKSNTRLFNLYGKGNVYECFGCFKGNKGGIPHILSQSKEKQKQNLFCNQCRYKFSSRKAVCPYCGKSSNLVVSNVTAVDLLG